MAQLTKGMFGSQFDRRNAVAFAGLSCGACRGNDFVHNGGWYNKAGEKLGWGDLSPDDFNKISQELEEGELFIILYESDSFWNFVTHNPGIIGSMCAVQPTAEAPGVDFVSEKCAYVIANGQLYYVDRYGDSDKETLVTRDGLEFKVLKREAAKALIASNTAQTV
jgi:hypothetical protein